MPSLVQFKDTRSVSSNEAELLILLRIPVMLRQQLCCKITLAKKKFYRITFPYIGMPKRNIHRILKPHQRHYYKAKCVSFRWVAMTVDCGCAVGNGRGGGPRYRTTALLSDQASCYTAVVVTLCSLQ
jgi:hypothetical protein